MGDLMDKLIDNGKLPCELCIKHTKDIVKALIHIAKHKCVHGDIKPDNLLVGKNNEIILCDFGSSTVVQNCVYDDYVTSHNGERGTRLYQAPEVVNYKIYGGTYIGGYGDIWSLGIVMYTMAMGHLPFECASHSSPGFSLFEEEWKGRNHGMLPSLEGVSFQSIGLPSNSTIFKCIIKHCLNPCNVQSRPRAIDILGYLP